jgi:thiamine-monophosphate kinase
MTTEFGVIAKFFARPASSAALGIGDDAALLAISPGMTLAASADMLLENVHFFPDTDPRKLGWKVLAVNISDLAAMGAQPRWALLSIALPRIDEPWLAAFCDGFFTCAKRHGVELVGGDTTRGPLAMNVTLLGEVPQQHALRRDAARAGDDVWVSGHLGGAALALAALRKRVHLEETGLAHCLRALETPQPRLALGLALREVAHAAIDVSDGLLADIGHILECSGVGAQLCFERLPAHPALRPWLDEDWGRQCLLAGGDDYELCFTASPQRRHDIEKIAHGLGLALTRIGRITPEAGLHLVDAKGVAMTVGKGGYDHFA